MKREEFMKNLYIFLSILGAIIPYYFFIPFLLENGLDIQRLFQQLFINHVSTFFATDFFISCVVFWAFLYQETKKYNIKQWWICIIATLIVGLSFALPLFLYFRLITIEKQELREK
jgi:Terpene cyclase DEP1